MNDITIPLDAPQLIDIELSPFKGVFVASEHLIVLDRRNVSIFWKNNSLPYPTFIISLYPDAAFVPFIPHWNGICVLATRGEILPRVGVVLFIF